MSKILQFLSTRILQYPKLVLVIILLITFGFAYAAFFSPKKLIVDFSLEQMFPENDPDRELYFQFVDEFSREDDVAFYIYECDNPFKKENLEIISNLTEELELIDGIESVLSIGNLDDGDHFNSDLDSTEITENILWLKHHPIYKNMLLSKSGKAGAIIIDLEDDIKDHDSREPIILNIESLINSTNYNWHGAGVPVMRTRYVHFVTDERTIFLPIAFVVVTVVLFVLFRQRKCVLLPLVAISVTLVWVAGLMALFGFTINVVSYLVFNLLMIIGVSDAIHILIKYHENLNKGLDKNTALAGVIKSIGSALFLTSFTTAVGFMSLMLTNIRITREFGFMLGVGVFLMFLLTITIIPVLLLLIKPPDKRHIKRLIIGERFQAAEKLNKWNELHPRIILGMTGVLFIFTFIGLFKMDYDSTILDDLRPGNKLFDDMMFVEDQFGGTLPLEIMLTSPNKGGILEPDFLKSIDTLKSQIEMIPEIGSIISFSDYIKIMNEELGTGKREIPETNEEVLALVWSFDDHENFINEELTKGRLTARLSNISTSRGAEIKAQILAECEHYIGSGFSPIVTGSTLLALKTNSYLVKNLTFSFLIAFTIIFFSMVVLFRSKRLALLSILPNVLPLMVAGAMMGYLGIKLRPSTAMTFSIALGIAVDDTIHFLSRFRQEFRIYKDYGRAISRTLLTTGKAIINTTIILGLGFFVFSFSRFVPNHEFGILATIILFVALAGSMVLLPVLIKFIQPNIRFKQEMKREI